MVVGARKRIMRDIGITVLKYINVYVKFMVINEIV